MKDLTNLRKIAEEVDNSPWAVQESFKNGGARVIDANGFALPGCFNCGENDAVYEEVDARHIATFDPPTVLDLITRLEQAEQAVARVRGLCTELRDTPVRPEAPDYVRHALAGVSNAAADILEALDGDTRG